MAIYLVGLGVNLANDVTVTGMEVVRRCSVFYLKYVDEYNVTIKDVENALGVSPTLISEDDEDQKRAIASICSSASRDVVVLCPGNTTGDYFYTLLALEAYKSRIQLQIIHSASIINYVGSSGLQLYRLGASCSFDETGWSSCIPVIEKNLSKNLHTLITFGVSDITPGLKLDIGKDISKCIFMSPDIIVVLLMAAGLPHQSVQKMSFKDFCCNEKPVEIPCCLVVCSDLHPLEGEAVDQLCKVFSCPDVSINHSGNTAASSGSGGSGPTFHLVGLGLGQPGDITTRGKRAIESSNKVYLESYTSVMTGGKDSLEEYFGNSIIVADRDMVEQESDTILPKDSETDVSLLVVGDPLGATTHADLLLRAVESGYSLDIVHNASIMNASTVCGLNWRNFGETVSIPFWDDSWRPDSFYDKICSNLYSGLHTLCLLDIKVKEQSVENLLKGRKIYEPPRFMTVFQACEQLNTIYEARKVGGKDISADDTETSAGNQNEVKHSEVEASNEGKSACSLLTSSTPIIGLARVGTKEERVVQGVLGDMSRVELGDPLHSMVIVGRMTEVEQQFLSRIIKT